MQRHNYYVPTVRPVVLNRHAQRLRERRIAYVRSQMDGQFDGGQPSLDGMRYRGVSYKLGEMLWAIEEMQDEQKVRPLSLHDEKKLLVFIAAVDHVRALRRAYNLHERPRHETA